MQLKPLTKGRFHNIWQQDDALIEKIFQELLSETQMIHEDEYLYRQGQVVDRLIMVQSGRISLRYSAENGRRFQLGAMECDEQLFGEMEFFTGYRCQLDIVAEEPLTVAVCSCDRLEEALNQHPRLAIFLPVRWRLIIRICWKSSCTGCSTLSFITWRMICIASIRTNSRWMVSIKIPGSRTVRHHRSGLSAGG